MGKLCFQYNKTPERIIDEIIRMSNQEIKLSDEKELCNPGPIPGNSELENYNHEHLEIDYSNFDESDIEAHVLKEPELKETNLKTNMHIHGESDDEDIEHNTVEYPRSSVNPLPYPFSEDPRSSVNPLPYPFSEYPRSSVNPLPYPFSC